VLENIVGRFIAGIAMEVKAHYFRIIFPRLIPRKIDDFH
jgi:hypothetical protein